MYSSPNIREII